MKKILYIYLFIFSSFVYAGDKWPIGIWNMLDDFTNQPEAIIQFYATPNGIEGKLNKIFYDPEDEVIENCIHCIGDNKDKPLVGLVTFSDLKYVNKQKLEGTVLDPETGKIYKCELTPYKNNKIKLHVIVNRILSEDRYLSKLRK
jgi:uncharacterized protein (DUF2147 family)